MRHGTIDDRKEKAFTTKAQRAQREGQGQRIILNVELLYDFSLIKEVPQFKIKN
jgi:hypothetical protein